MMGTLFLRGVTVAPKISCSVVPTRCCMENFWEKKQKKMSDLNAKVSARTQISPLPNVEIKNEWLNGKMQEEVLQKELAFSDGIGIVKFLPGKVFLITGATGFLAKVLIEKILRSVPDVGKIYLLIKAKDGEAAMQRLESEIINTELFKVLQQTHGKSYQKFLLSKLVPVLGNISEPNLGMEVGLAERIANEVDIVINSAANTTLDERFDVSLGTNTFGPSRFLRCAKKFKKLLLFVHVSTAYVNGERQGRVMEKQFYMGDSIARERAISESPTRSFPLLDIEAESNRVLDAREDSQGKVMSQKMKDLGLERATTYGWQDTYTFTKAMGEMMIDSEREDIPVVIIRPSIIESTYKEPFPGWIEGIRMLDPLVLSYGKGELTGFPVDTEGVIDTVPVDMVVNTILAATVKHATIRKPGLSIYHVASSVVNPLLLQNLFTCMFEYFKSSPYKDLKMNPINIRKMKLFNCMDDFDSHIQTEAVRRSAAEGVNSSRRLQKSLDIAKHLAVIYEPYMFYGGRFDNSNTQRLLEEMSEEEKRSFGIDVRKIDWKDYICNIHIPGLMTHVLKGRGM